ncbi:helix-turn-helix domain-containing protein [Botrimarina sp.]|uniref:helix-turn-helix domain-containing protein n=1 Tax=Botrimarina sp. TaxID=2795802 RepID=UPI0032ECF1A3
MSQKFISLDDAAAKLGVPKERLNQLREAGDLRAYRDGPSWKFRTEEIEKLEAEGLPGEGPPSDDALSLDSGELSLEDPPTPGPAPIEPPPAENKGADTPAEAAVDDSDDDDDIGLGVEPLGEGDDAESILLTDEDVGPPRPQSTIIGKSELSLESDLALASGSDDAPAPSGGPASSTPALAGESGELELDTGAAPPAGSAAGKSDPQLDDDDDDLELDLAGSDASQSGSGSMAGFSGIDLAADDDDDLVLGGSDGSDPAAGDSGVNLAPSDSGFSLDEVPPDLSGSAIGSSLDLASLSAAGSGVSGLGGSAVSNEDFQLTPDEAGDDEEDSSQVVSLDDMEESEEDLPAFDSIDEDDEDGFGEGLGAGGLGGPSGLGVEGAGVATAPVMSQEATFPGWILGFLCASLLACLLCGFLALELLRSMWTYEEPFSFSSSVMESLASLISG